MDPYVFTERHVLLLFYLKLLTFISLTFSVVTLVKLFKAAPYVTIWCLLLFASDPAVSSFADSGLQT
jgi:hypothetical protein